MTKDEGNSDDVAVIVFVRTFPVGFGEGLGELLVLLCLEGLGGFKVKVTTKAYLQQEELGCVFFVICGVCGMSVKPQVVVSLWNGEEDVWPEDVLVPLKFRWKVRIRDSAMGSEVQVVGPPCIKDNLRVPYVRVFRIGE